MRTTKLIVIWIAACGLATGACGGDGFEPGPLADGAGAGGAAGTATAGGKGAGSASGAAGSSGSQAGGAGHGCQPGQYQCKGDELWGCTSDGSQQVKVDVCSAGACAPELGACLACKPSMVVGCSGPTALAVCSTSGTVKKSVPCPSDKPRCDNGECVECSEDGQCPGGSAAELCVAPKCVSGHCALEPIAAGPASKQTPNDCKRVDCSATGASLLVADPTDVPASDGDDCTVEACDGQTPLHKQAPVGTPCGPEKKGSCTAAGACGACVLGDERCNDGVHETCDDQGHWLLDPCPGSKVCSTGACRAVTQITAGDFHTCALLEDGRVRCWGANDSGQLGDGTSGAGKAELRPKEVLQLTDATFIDAGDQHTCAIRKGGTVVCWGANDDGQLGVGSAGGPFATSPVAVEALAGVATVSAGSRFTCAATQDSTIYCWGLDFFSQLGDGGSQMVVTAPKKVANVTGGLLSTGRYHVCSVGGSLLCWGYNASHQAGSATGDVLFPTKYGLVLPVAGIYLGGDHSCLVTTTGDSRCWGENSDGQLAIGKASSSENALTTNFDSTPGPMALGAWHTCHVGKTVECAGANDHFQLGRGNKPLPKDADPAVVTVAMGAGPAAIDGKLVVSIAAGESHTCAVADKTYCWGKGSSGQLGNGAAVDQPSAVPVAW